MKRAVWPALALLGVLLLIRIGFGLGRRQSDAEQIRDELSRSLAASKDGKPGSVLELLSNQLTFNDQEASTNFGSIADFIRKQRPDIVVQSPDPVVTGDVAQIYSPVDVNLDLLGQRKSIHLKAVVLIFHREPATELIVFPATRWRLAQVQVPQSSLVDFAQ